MSPEDTGEYQPVKRSAPRWTAAAPAQVDVAGLTDQGRVRSNNEDHFLIIRYGRHVELVDTNIPAGQMPPRAEEIGYGMAVADGLGGSVAGELASELALRTLLLLAVQEPDWILRFEDPLFINEALHRAAVRYEHVHAKLGAEARRDPTLSGFGTTLTMARTLGKELLVAHVGDSRVYRFRAGTLERLTRDHTLAQARVEAGHISQDEVASHPLRHILHQVIGDTRGDVYPDVRRHQLQDSDVLLVCTDGLTEMVPEEQIATVLASAESAAAACRQLVDAALAAGGKDNITAVVARYRFAHS